ncbi:MAG: hypothetical protein JXJ17_07800 [Anaerolineae bacterium]|nr:hypothetical protein [Anaerolineae bacterium]
MRIGMLWFDNHSQRDLETKLRRAVIYYENKYGSRPTMCHVHPSMLVGQQSEIAGVAMEPSNLVLPHHFWLGQGGDVKKLTAA